MNHRYRKRIISRATDKPTCLIRIITAEEKITEELLKEDFFYKNCHYPVLIGLAPLPDPISCRKWSLCTHSTENCNETPKCNNVWEYTTLANVHPLYNRNA